MDDIEIWAAKNNWPQPLYSPPLRVQVSSQFENSRSLVPYWMGDQGRMEFPSFRVAVGDAAIMHELAHVYFPNANRMLAEGLAIYLQIEIGKNFAFPNFEKNVHRMVRCELRVGRPDHYKGIRIASLEQIGIGLHLPLRIEEITYSDGWTYTIAGSFVRFLIEEYGLDKFRAVYAKTPLAPLLRDPGPPARWVAVYGLTIEELDSKWKAKLAMINC
jgi:hypothetical protein